MGVANTYYIWRCKNGAAGRRKNGNNFPLPNIKNQYNKMNNSDAVLKITTT